MNFLVLVANNYMMPVKIPKHFNLKKIEVAKKNLKTHFFYNDKSKVKFWFFTDIFKIRTRMYSFGDILLRISQLSMIIFVIIIYFYLFML